LAEVLQLHGEFAWATGAWDQAHADAKAALELARNPGTGPAVRPAPESGEPSGEPGAATDVRRQARALELLSRVAQNRGQHTQAHIQLVQAQALYRSIADPAG